MRMTSHQSAQAQKLDLHGTSEIVEPAHVYSANIELERQTYTGARRVDCIDGRTYLWSNFMARLSCPGHQSRHPHRSAGESPQIVPRAARTEHPLTVFRTLQNGVVCQRLVRQARQREGERRREYESLVRVCETTVCVGLVATGGVQRTTRAGCAMCVSDDDEPV